MQKEITILNNDLFEDLTSKYPDFDFQLCIPTEEDFNKITTRFLDYKTNKENADYISTPWGLARSVKNKYKQIKYFIVAKLIGYDELVFALQKELKKNFVKDDIVEIFNYIKLHSNELANYANAAKKYIGMKTEPLTEASNNMSPYDKMKAFDQGQRRENVKACGEVKLCDYYRLCANYNFENARQQIGAELIKRGLGRFLFIGSLTKLPDLQPTDFKNLDAFNVNNKTAVELIRDFEENPIPIETAIIGLIKTLMLALCLRKTDYVEELKNYLVGKGLLKGDFLKNYIKIAINNPQINLAISNILKDNLHEAIEKHDKLNPKLWNVDATLKSEVKDKILEIVKEFETNLAEDNIKFNVKDIILVGSNVNYNYTKDSDLDIHIITDTSSLNCPDNLYPALYSAYRSLFNKNLDIEFYGIPVEIYIETEESPRVSNGCYSVSQDKWINEPKIENIPDYDEEQLNNLIMEWETKYHELLNKDNLTADDINSFIEQIYELRKEGLASGSEWDVKNLTFKEFRNRGYLDHLKELKNEIRGKELSLESLAEDTEKVKDHKWVNKGKEGTHGEFKTKKEADAQRKAMFANGFHEDYDTIEQYKTKLRQITHYIPMIQENGLFELYNIPETDVYSIMNKLNQLSEVEWVQKAQSSFDFNHFTMSGQPKSRYKIYGQLKF